MNGLKWDKKPHEIKTRHNEQVNTCICQIARSYLHTLQKRMPRRDLYDFLKVSYEIIY